MGMTVQIPDWRLNYRVAAFGTYATVLVESTYLILGGFENASPLSISILTNGSAVLVAGFGGASSTPFALVRICLTSLFLLWAVIVQGNEPFDGTYAVLCSVAHFFYQLRLRHDGDLSGESLPRHEKGEKNDGSPSESGLQVPATNYNDAAESSRNLRVIFGDCFCLEGEMVPVTITGTVMTYRVFDFDLGFGLVFAFMSAFLSSIILLFINYARKRGRRMETQKALQMLVSLMVVIGPSCFAFFTIVEVPVVWWKFTFGVAWFIFLYRCTYVACRFLLHATLFSCVACSQREAGNYGPLNQEASIHCMWDNYVKLPALNQDDDDKLVGSSTFRIRRQKGPDLVERIWLNDQEWCQLSPRSFVIFMVTCIALATVSGGALNVDGTFASLGSHVTKNTAFYVTVIFTFVSTGHTPNRDSPELMFDAPSHSFPDWKATARAIIATMLVHAYLVLAPFWVDFSFAVPLACTIVAPLLLAGISKRTIQLNCETGPEDETVEANSDEPTSPSTNVWTIDSTMVYSSSKIRCLDLRVLLLGLSVTMFDVLCNRYQDEVSGVKWPISAFVSISVTTLWLYLENLLPRSRELESGLLYPAVAALVGVFSHANFLNAFGLYDNESEDENAKHTKPVPDNASHSNAIIIALWYTTLIYMVVTNRRLVHQNADRVFPTRNKQRPRRDRLLFSFHVKTSRLDFRWHLRNSRVAVSLLFTMLASCAGESWPLDMSTTVSDLLLFALIVSFQLRPRSNDPDEKGSLYHVAALGLSALTTILAVCLNRHGVFDSLVSDPKKDWKLGACFALVSYQLCCSFESTLKSRGWVTRRNATEAPPPGALQVAEIDMAQEGEKGSGFDANAHDRGTSCEDEKS